MFVKTTDSNTGLLHHIGNADAFKTEFAKPLGRDAYDPSVCFCLISFRITHLSSRFLPKRAGFALIAAHVSGWEQRELREYYRNPYHLDAGRFFWVQQIVKVDDQSEIKVGSKKHAKRF